MPTLVLIADGLSDKVVTELTSLDLLLSAFVGDGEENPHVIKILLWKDQNPPLSNESRRKWIVRSESLNELLKEYCDSTILHWIISERGYSAQWSWWMDRWPQEHLSFCEVVKGDSPFYWNDFPIRETQLHLYRPNYNRDQKIFSHPLVAKNFPSLLILEKEKIRPTLFLDRDGVVIEDRHYLKDSEGICLIDEIIELMVHYQKKGYLIIVLSNQAGIGKGLLTESDHQMVTSALNKLLIQRGVVVDQFFHAPYHSSSCNPWYNKNLFWRKPFPGMLYDALQQFPIDLSRSIMIGDKESDFFPLCPIKTYLLQGKYPISDSSNYKVFTTPKNLLDYLTC